MSLEQDEEKILKDVTIVVRSLITSLKPPVSLRTIERDYMKEEHAPIPFRSLGYRSTLELLEDTNAFSFQKIGDEVSDLAVDLPHNGRNTCILVLIHSLSRALPL